MWHRRPLCITACLLTVPANRDPNISFCSNPSDNYICLLSCSSNKQGKDPALEESDFDRETARLAVRMLTARAAGMVLQNVAEVDDFKAAWLQEHFKQVGQRNKVDVQLLIRAVQGRSQCACAAAAQQHTEVALPLGRTL